VTDLLQLHERATSETERLIRGVKEDQLTDPTGLGDWDVRSVIGHLVAGNRTFGGVASGGSMDGVGSAVAEDADAEAYADTAAAMRDAWSEPGALERDVPMGFGPAPGSVVVTMHLIETIVHGWDVARATDQLPSYDDEAVGVADGFARKMMPADKRPAGGAFGPPVEPPDGASPVDSLAAFAGRLPG
jgi:uncharacterized protein (TIGR03086 family)